jgi:hypothetical protein
MKICGSETSSRLNVSEGKSLKFSKGLKRESSGRPEKGGTRNLGARVKAWNTDHGPQEKEV